MCSRPKIEMQAPTPPPAAPAPAPVESPNKQKDIVTFAERKKNAARGKNKLTIQQSSGTGLNI